jgi:hypothetical protein
MNRSGRKTWRTGHRNSTGVPPITGTPAGLAYISGRKRTLQRKEADHDIAWHRRYPFVPLAALEPVGGIVRRMAATHAIAP